MKFGVIIFPGSNCDQDLIHVLNQVSNQETVKLWHKDTDLHGCTHIFVPGGFSYGDYLRSGAIAKLSPVMESVIAHANAGGFVMGICNGFQILTETGLLPGALLRNSGLKYICKTVDLNVETANSIFTNKYNLSNVIRLPIAHHDGNYNADVSDIEKMRDQDLIAFSYCDNPNGSIENIAGILSSNRRVLGMMPHPERASEKAHGNLVGVGFFKGLVESVSTA